MRLSFWLLMGLAASGCVVDRPAAPTTPVDVTVVLAPNEVTEIAGASMRVRFHGVLADSRCPADVNCITAGDAVVRIDVMPPGGGLSTYDLHTADGRPVRVGDTTIALRELSPYPFVSRPVAPSDYRARLRVTR
jgi:hypothetical protein